MSWREVAGLNEIIDVGCYVVQLKHGAGKYELPLPACNKEHYITATLIVTESGTDDTLQKNRVIGQTLILPQCDDGNVAMYSRSYNNLPGKEYKWSHWISTQLNTQVGQVTSLDGFTQGGIYSGVYMSQDSSLETFVLTVIDNDVAATASGKVRSISQFKNSLLVDGTFSYKTRVGRGKGAITWGSWMDIGAADTADIQDNSITAQKLSTEVRENVDKIPLLEWNLTSGKTALLNGDFIVGLAREVYSRQGRADTATFLGRTTAGRTSISDGIATLRQIGGNIVKNMIDSLYYTNVTKEHIQKVESGIATTNDMNSHMVIWGLGPNPYRAGHIYYCSATVYNENAKDVVVALKADGTGVTLSEKKEWLSVSLRQTMTLSKADVTYRPFISVDVGSGTLIHIKKWFIIDLTEMFGMGYEPTKDVCDKMFGAMDALPQGLSVAGTSRFKSIGYNQLDPLNILTDKSVANDLIVDGDKYVAVVECLPCKTGAGENNGYVIGYGEGEKWSDAGIEVYLTPLNPKVVEGKLYLHRLEKNVTTGTYVPAIKGYMLVVTPIADKLCAHLHWSGDRVVTEYEGYVESNVVLPSVPEMSEWGLAGFSVNGTVVQDVIDFESCKYIRRVGCVDLGTLTWSRTSGGNYYAKVPGKGGTKVLSGKYVSTSSLYDGQDIEDMTICTNNNDFASVLVRDTSCANTEAFRLAVAGVFMYYELASHEEFPILAKMAPNYMVSDYGVEAFIGSQVPLSANILFYMRSLVCEIRNFLDRLMAGLGVSDVTDAADKIMEIMVQTKDSLSQSGAND